MTTTEAFAVPIGERYFEDYRPGAAYEFGHAAFTEAEIVEFARRFDPQSFHVDRETAQDGPFGGLIASGWHTASVLMRLFAGHYLSTVASLGGPGADELRWLKPVRPGTTVRLRVTVLDTQPSRSKPDRGLVRTLAELIDQDDDVVLRLTVLNFLRRKAFPEA
ncbi:MaoC family dehydratase [Amycolatopsis sp. NPDC059021]|uniref:MaoC family dehydratase n=1 Tax=Amycolatopsis sp. NPDC059021 TaxID=3346704 RepID=UPI00366AE3DA